MIPRRLLMKLTFAAISAYLLINAFISVESRYSDVVQSNEIRLTMTSSKKSSIVGRNTQVPRRKVIILTYMRSGSSLTGDLIQQHPDVFYVYEPLKTIGRQFEGLNQERWIHYSDNTSISAAWTGPGNPPFYIKTMDSVLKCQFHKLDNGTLKQNHMELSKSTIEAFECIKNISQSQSDWQQLMTCVDTINIKCLDANVIAVKCIRLRMIQAEVLMSADPSLRIIHLIRDPRPVILSRQIFPQFHYVPHETQARILCSQMLEDISISKSISKKMPNRILTVRYEDIAEFPIAAFRQLYKFLDLEMSSNIENYIWNITYRGIKNGCRKCFVRNNATETANAWRLRMDYRSISSIQKACLPLMNKMGYRLFQFSDEVTNVNISSKYASYDSDLMKVVV